MCEFINYAWFADIEDVTREEVFDENIKKKITCTGQRTLDKQDARREQIGTDESLAKSRSDVYNPSGKSRHLLVFNFRQSV